MEHCALIRFFRYKVRSSPVTLNITLNKVNDFHSYLAIFSEEKFWLNVNFFIAFKRFLL